MTDKNVLETCEPFDDINQAIIFATSAPLLEEQWRFILKNMQGMEASDKKSIGKVIDEVSKSFQYMQVRNEAEINEIKASAKVIGNAMRALAKGIPLLEGKLAGYPFFKKEEQIEALAEVVYGGKLKKNVKEKVVCALLDIVFVMNHGLSIFSSLPTVANKKLKAEISSAASAGRIVLSLHMNEMCEDLFVLENEQKMKPAKKPKTK